MDSLIAEIAVAGVPDPMPVVMESVLGEGLQGRRPGPQIVVDARRDRLDGRMPNGVAPLITKASCQVPLTDQARLHLVHGFANGCARTALAPVLADHLILLNGPDQLPAFPPIVRTRLLEVHVLPSLRRPDAHERMPVVRGRNRNGIEVFVFEQLAKIDFRLGLWKSHAFGIGEPFPEDIFINITEAGNFNTRDAFIPLDMIPSATAHPHDGQTNPVVRSHDLSRGSGRGETGSGGSKAGFQKTSPCRLFQILV